MDLKTANEASRTLTGHLSGKEIAHMKFQKGQQVNKWKLTMRLKSEGRCGYEWLAECACGKIGYVTEVSLRNGVAAGCKKCATTASITKSLITRNKNKRETKLKGKIVNFHGLGQDPQYIRWAGMIGRCYRKDGASYCYYGGRGIYVCDRWRIGEDGKTGLQCFREDMGHCPPGKSIDRINNDGPYSPENCRWATPSEQMQNSRPVIRAREKKMQSAKSRG